MNSNVKSMSRSKTLCSIISRLYGCRIVNMRIAHFSRIASVSLFCCMIARIFVFGFIVMSSASDHCIQTLLIQVYTVWLDANCPAKHKLLCMDCGYILRKLGDSRCASSLKLDVSSWKMAGEIKVIIMRRVFYGGQGSGLTRIRVNLLALHTGRFLLPLVSGVPGI